VDIELITWSDSAILDWGWCDVEDLNEGLYFIESIGFVINEEDEWVLLASHYAIEKPNHINTPMLIPKSCIVRREKIKRARKS